MNSLLLLSALVGAGLAPAEIPAQTLVAPPAPISVELSFRTLRDWDVSLPAERFLPLGEALPLFGTDGFRVGVEEGSLAFDRDGDGVFDAKVETTDKEHPTRLLTFQAIGEDGKRRSFAVRARNQGRWQYAPAGAMEGRVGKTRIAIFDQDGNGRFDDYGVDAMILGRGKTAAFLSRTIHVDGELFEIDVKADGTGATLTAHSGPVGKLDLGSALETKAKMRSIVLLDEQNENSFEFSGLLAGEVSVPAGRYRLHSGEVVLGKSSAKLHTGRAELIEVTANGSTQLAWGGPVQSEFGYQRSGGELQIAPQDVEYYGRAGELYTDFMPLGSSPRFFVKDKATGDVLVDMVFPGNC